MNTSELFSETHCRVRSHMRAAGFTLIELLITIAIIAHPCFDAASRAERGQGEVVQDLL